ncbi:hypothetical protein [Tsukamurella soli]|uniref:Glycosyl transferase, family 25 n=2 Tax=Tsukamurella soli TaxID=644556 RepID=A0ABP8JJB6_9ACTN
MDTGARGSLVNHDLAWHQLADRSDADWLIVLEDDAVPCRDFLDRAADALAYAPSVAVSFYVGTGRPLGRRIIRALLAAEQAGNVWLTNPGLLWGVGVALRADIVKPMLDGVTEIRRPYDERMGEWLASHKIPVAYTLPSLVDHEDGQSIIGTDRPEMVRKAHKLGPMPLSWKTPATAI